ncbi:MAG: hypothetical protein IPN38_07830 [Flavobacteriales bacterium]|nr:hypothetical protein [Flavobacteriales bacterium]
MDKFTQRKQRRAAWTFSALLVTLLLVLYAVRVHYTPGWNVLNWGGFFIYGICGFVLLSILFSAILNWSTRTLRDLFFPFTLFIAAFSCAFYFHHLSERRRSVPVFFEAYYDGDYNGTGIRLRTDGTYELSDGGVLGGDLFYGTYRLAGDTIHLETEDFRFGEATWGFSKRLVIGSEGVLYMNNPAPLDARLFAMRGIQDDRPR